MLIDTNIFLEILLEQEQRVFPCGTGFATPSLSFLV